MLKLITIKDYLLHKEAPVLLDARSEGEFESGHIPGATSFPILNNEERKEVGTCYKRNGHEAAVILGYRLVGHKFHSYIERAYSEFTGRVIYLHCWRGGLRSQILGNLLLSAGFQVNLIKGGYKAYRKEVLEFFAPELKLSVLGGYTGSAKTEWLIKLQEMGEQVIDIEGMASHKGSAFGGIGLDPQPRQEQFENNLFEQVRKLDFTKPVWVEDESRLIGKLQVPAGIYSGISNGRFFFLDVPFENRLTHIVEEYGVISNEILIEKTRNLRKRMGDLANRQSIEHLESGKVREWAAMVLTHYDRQYAHGLSRRKKEETTFISGEEALNPIRFLLSAKK